MMRSSSFLLLAAMVLGRPAGAPPKSLAPSRAPLPGTPVRVLAPAADTGPDAVTTDTGAFAPGHKDFSRYTTLGLCLAAAQVARHSSYHTLAALAAHDTSDVDTVGLAATAVVARQCVRGRFTLANTKLQDVADLFQLALYERDDTLARAALSSMVAQDPENRATIWGRAMRKYIAFGRVAEAETLLAKIDADKTVEGGEQLDMHSLWLDHLLRTSDTVRVQRELDRMLVLALAIRDADTQASEWAVHRIWGTRVLLALPARPDSVLALARQAQAMLQKYPSSEQKEGHYKTGWGEIPLDSVLMRLTAGSEWYAESNLMRGHGPAPRLHADYWFPAPGQDTVVPVPGKVNVICMGGDLTDMWPDNFNGMSLSSGYQQAEKLRRWVQRYGAKGLAVTVVRTADSAELKYKSELYGYGNKKVFWTPAAAAQLWRWYEQVYSQLPVTVAVQVERTTEWLPQPDGRRLRTTADSSVGVGSPQVSEFFGRHRPLPGACTVIDRNGTLIISRNDARHGYASAGYADTPLDNVLKRLFASPGADSPSQRDTRPHGSTPAVQTRSGPAGSAASDVPPKHVQGVTP